MRKLFKKNKKICLVVFIIISIFIIIKYNYDYPKLKLKNDVITIEYGERLSKNLLEYLDTSIYENKNEIDKIEYHSNDMRHDKKLEVGEYEIVYEYRQAKATLKIKVKDTTKPKLSIAQDINLVEKEKFHYSSYLEVSELSRYDVYVDDSKVDYNVAGVYPMNITVEDIYNNNENIAFQINIKKLELSISSTSLVIDKYGSNKISLNTNIPRTIVYVSSNPKVATVDYLGNIQAINYGTTTISAIVNDNKLECVVTVPQPKVTSNEPTISYTVYVTDTGSKYHNAGCRYLWNSKYSISKNNAISQGYSPCRVCKP